MARAPLLAAALCWAVLVMVAARAEQSGDHPLLQRQERGLRNLGRVLGGAACPKGLKLCRGKCVNILKNPFNCGVCGRTCQSRLCMMGKCFCARGRSKCLEGMVVKCKNLTVDVHNCGKCKKRCTTAGVPQVCTMGACVCPKGTKRVSCPVALTGGTSLVCLDLKTDPKNCGSCGNVCPGKCTNGTCVCTLPGYTQCGAACSNLTTDPARCGSCTNNCGQLPTPETEDWCCNGQCPNKNNCGKCGLKCAANQECCFSLCGVDGLSCHQCADLSSDDGNCGTCGNLCVLSQSCQSGECQDIL